MVLTVAIMYLAVFIQGGFFATAYLPLGILALLGIPFIAKKIPGLRLTLPFVLLSIIFLASVFATGVTVESLKCFLKVIVCLLFWILLFNVKDKDSISRSIVILGFTVSVLGIVSYTILPQGGMVNLKRLQGVFQYANAMGIFTAACAMTANESENTKYKYMILPMEAALLLTQSAGSILFYLIGMFTAIYIKNKNNSHEISEFVIKFSISFMTAAVIYLLPQNIKFLSLIVLVILIAFQKNIDLYCSKFKIPSAVVLSFIGAAAVCLTVVRRGRFIETFLERLIQIYDGIMAISSNILTGLGPGNWAIQRFEWQTLDYTAAYVHSSIIQFGADAGIGAVIIAALMYIFYFKYPINNKPYIFSAGAVIIFHSLIDATFNFTGVIFLLMALFYIRTNEAAAIKLPRWSTILTVVIILPPFIFLTSWNFRYNQAIKSNEPIKMLLTLEKTPIKSYTESFALANLYYNSGMSDEFYKQIQKVPYKTSDVYYLEAKELLKEGKYEEALRVDYLCINKSKMQLYGYNLADEIINKLPEEEKKKQQNILDEYKSDAQKRRHLLSYYIKK